jgi:hypothetical protein
LHEAHFSRFQGFDPNCNRQRISRKGTAASTSSIQETMNTSSTKSTDEKLAIYDRKREIVDAENKQVCDAVHTNNVYHMEKLFKTSGIKQDIIDHFIFYVGSVEMLKLFLRYGGDMHKLGPSISFVFSRFQIKWIRRGK